LVVENHRPGTLFESGKKLMALAVILFGATNFLLSERSIVDSRRSYYLVMQFLSGNANYDTKYVKIAQEAQWYDYYRFL